MAYIGSKPADKVLVLGDGVVSTAKLADDAVTNAKIADDVIGTEHFTSGTIEPSGDTSSGDNAAIGYTATEGLILTGQGSTSDVTLKNDADATVFTVPTGTDDILFADSAKGMWGTGSDLTLYHDGSNSYITNSQGALKLATETSGIAVTIGHTTSEVTVADNLTVAGNLTATQFIGGGLNPYRNIFINGDMSIAQRGTSTASVTTSDGYYACDRWKTQTDTGTWTISQSTDVPSGQGFYYSMKLDCTSAGSSNADEITLTQKFEGQMLQHWKFGTASAESLSLSFWIKTNKTGTYSAVLFNANSDQERIASFDYTVSSADTWEKKTITFPGDTSRIIKNTNTEEFSVKLYFGTPNGSGVTNTWQNAAAGYWSSGNLAGLGGSTDDEVYITGTQLEVGTSASDFEFLPFDVNLRRCQRYYAVVADRRTSGVNPIRDQRSIGIGTTHYPNQVSVQLVFPTEMRSVPSLDQASGTDYYQYYHETTGDNFDDFNTIGGNGVSTMLVRNTDNISASHGISGTVMASDGNSYVALEAEL